MYQIFRARLVTMVLVFIFLLIGSLGLAAQETRPELVGNTPVASGVFLKEYFWLTANGPAKIFVLEVDLKNPYIEVETILGKGKVTERSNVTAMARDTGAVAAINADFFNTQAEGAPIGPTVVSGELVTSPFNMGRVFAFGVTNAKEAFINDFHFFGKVTAPNGNSFDISGLNKTIYTAHDNTHSHRDRLYIYDHMWGSNSRGHDGLTVPTEILVHNNKVVRIYQGEYFNGRLAPDTYILRASGVAAEFLVNNFKVGDEIQIEYSMLPNRDWSMLVGGHSLLVFNGQTVPYGKEKNVLDGLRARSAAGISQDRNTIYLVGVEGRTADSVGLNLDNLAQFFVHIGAWQALNLDGGGSTTMVTRPLGEKEASKAFPTEQGWERMVVNAIGIYSTAPKGEFKDIVLSGKGSLVVGETAKYTVNAYDEYYNPIDISDLNIAWQLADNLGTFSDGTFQANKPGQTKIRVTVNNITKELPITIGEKSLAEEKTRNNPWSEAGLGSVTGSTVNIRSGPDTSYPVLTQVFRGVTVKVIHQEGDWLQIALPNGTIGWIAAWLVDFTPLSATITGNVVNIRRGPGTGEEVLVQLRKGDSVTVLSKDNDWLKIVLPDGSIGWIADWLLEPTTSK